jgi:hypothetical protein
MSLKTVPDHIIKSRVLRTGDGTHIHSIEAAIEASEKKQLEMNRDNNNNINEKIRSRKKLEVKEDKFPENFWGFGDKDMTSEDLQRVKILKIA